MTYYATFSGKTIDFECISINDICLEDIAHHLSRIQRFGGALPYGVSYSVADHSINVAKYMMTQTNNNNDILYALMHDATEAYLGDIVTGLKQHMTSYKKMEKDLDTLICTKYNIDRKAKEKIKQIDTCIVLDEAKALMPNKYYLYKHQLRHVEPLGIEVICNRHGYKTKQLFIDYAKMLGIKK